MKYDLASMVKGRRAGSRAMMPQIQHSPGMERSYLAQLRVLEQEVARCIRDIILPRYAQKLVTDADEDSFTAMRLLVDAMTNQVKRNIRELVFLEGKRHTKAWMRAARATFGIDLSAVVTEEGLESFLETVALRNAGLITGLADDMMKRVSQETTTALLQGQRASQLQVKLKEQLEISDSRARLIARDQTSKLTSDLNRKRQEEAGVDSYIWRTSQDERVRSRHRALEGKEYEYGKPTQAEDGLPPGQPIQCRCIAQGVVVF